MPWYSCRPLIVAVFGNFSKADYVWPCARVFRPPWPSLVFGLTRAPEVLLDTIGRDSSRMRNGQSEEVLVSCSGFPGSGNTYTCTYTTVWDSDTDPSRQLGPNRNGVKHWMKPDAPVENGLAQPRAEKIEMEGPNVDASTHGKSHREEDASSTKDPPALSDLMSTEMDDSCSSSASVASSSSSLPKDDERVYRKEKIRIGIPVASRDPLGKASPSSGEFDSLPMRKHERRDARNTMAWQDMWEQTAGERRENVLLGMVEAKVKKSAHTKEFTDGVDFDYKLSRFLRHEFGGTDW